MKYFDFVAMYIVNGACHAFIIRSREPRKRSLNMLQELQNVVQRLICR